MRTRCQRPGSPRRNGPDWERLVCDVADGLLDIVVMWESSRGSRKLSVWVDFLDLCRERKIMIHVTTHRRTYDMSIRRDRKTLVNDGVENEDDSEQISEGVRRALKDNARNGLPHGICKWGYERIHDENTGRCWASARCRSRRRSSRRSSAGRLPASPSP